MKKRKLIIFIAALVCLLLVGGGSYAYYTTNVVTHNVVSSGSVEVELVELKDDGSHFENIEGAVPGKSYAKVVMADNTGASDAWIRIRLDKLIEPAKGVTAELDPSLVKLDIQDGDWTEKDGWYYYNSPLKPGERSKALFSSVGFTGNMGNEWQNSKVFIKVKLQAVQVANNGSSALTADGWPLS